MAELGTVAALILRIFHILFGIAWIGAVAFGVGVIRRAMPKVDPAARKATMRQLIPIILQYVPGSAAMTIITGALLYAYLGAFRPSLLFGTSWGLTLLAALVLALVTFGIGMLVGVRTGKKILGHLNEESCTHQPEVGALQARFNLTQVVVLVLGLIIVSLMAIATTRIV